MSRRVGIVIGVLAILLFGFSNISFSGQIALKSVVAKEPIAQLIELKLSAGEQGVLERAGNTYNIKKLGIGFKKGDTFTLQATNAGSYAIITLNKKGNSYVKLGPGASITFIDDDGNYAITGVYVESSDPTTNPDATFNINHASASSPFFIWTPDIIVGVRGTWVELDVGEPTATGVSKPTTVNVDVKPGSSVSEDVHIYPIDPSKLKLNRSNALSNAANWDNETTLSSNTVAGVMDDTGGKVGIIDNGGGISYIQLNATGQKIRVDVAALNITNPGSEDIPRVPIRLLHKAAKQKHKKHKHKKDKRSFVNLVQRLISWVFPWD